MLFLLAIAQYIVYLHSTLLSSNPQDILAAYEGGWNRTTDKFYQKTEWPEAEVISPLVNNGTRNKPIPFFFAAPFPLSIRNASGAGF